MSTINTVTGTGASQRVSLTFDFIDTSHVKVYANNTPLSYTWTGPAEVQFTAPAGSAVRVQRETPTDSLVTFNPTGATSYSDLNLSAQQGLYVGAEASRDALKAATDYTSSAYASVLSRSSHTGTQPSSTISDFTEAVQDVMGATLVAGSNISVVYNDASNTVTITGSGTFSTDWSAIGNKPATFPPSAHTHATAEVTGLDAALAGKASASHSHAWGTVTGTLSAQTDLQNALNAKLNLAGGTVTGDVFTNSNVSIKMGTGYADATSGMRIAKEATSAAYIDNFDGLLVFRRAAYAETFRFSSSGQFGLGGANYGATGQVIAANASGPPSWSDIGALMSSMALGALGQYGFFQCASALSAGTTVAGSSLAYSCSNNIASGVPSGTWRILGNNIANSSSLYQRVA